METKALVVDSSMKVRQNIARSLKEIDVRSIVEANDGNEAMELFKTGTYGILFAEYNTPTNSGDTLVSAIRKINKSLPIIATVPQSKKMAEIKKQCPSATDYLTTPFTTEQLRAKVEECCPTLAG